MALTRIKNAALDPSTGITADQLDVGQLGGRRNLIINGAMQVAQRGTSRSFGQSYNALDRWATGQYQQAGHEQVSVTDSSVPVKKAIRVTSSNTTEAASGTRMAVGQMVESQDCDFLAGKTVTLSFWIRFSASTVTGTTSGFVFQLGEYDSVDPNFRTNGPTRESNTYIANGSYPTSWTKYTKTITCASTMKNLGARFLFSNLFNTTNNGDVWYEITGVQLEVGSVATPFEHRSYGEELALCQRYFTIYPKNGQSGNGASAWPMWNSSSTQGNTRITIPGTVPMRVRPTVTMKGTISASPGASGTMGIYYQGWRASPSLSGAVEITSDPSIRVDINCAGGLVSGGASGYYIYSEGTDPTASTWAGFMFDAEL